MTSQPECQVSSDGSKYWYLNGKLHREDGPACEYPNGSKYWYLNDKRHREDGPAFEWTDGYRAWWLNGKYLDPEEAIRNHELQKRYPSLIASMAVYLVHSS